MDEVYYGAYSLRWAVVPMKKKKKAWNTGLGGYGVLWQGFYCVNPTQQTQYPTHPQYSKP